MKIIQIIALIITLIGGINWGLIGLFDYNLVGDLFGGDYSGMSKLIYSLVGFSTLINLRLLFMLFDRANEEK